MTIFDFCDKHNLKVQYGGVESSKLKSGQPLSPQDYFCTYMVVSKLQLESLKNLGYTQEDLINEMGVNFLLLQIEGRLKFYHICADPSCEESIRKKGLIPSTDWVADLGKGVYVIDDYDWGAYNSLIDYFSELAEDDMSKSYLEVRGTYNDSYIQCINSEEGYEDHIGYIVLPNVTPEQIEEIHKTTLAELLGVQGF